MSNCRVEKPKHSETVRRFCVGSIAHIAPRPPASLAWFCRVRGCAKRCGVNPVIGADSISHGQERAGGFGLRRTPSHASTARGCVTVWSNAALIASSAPTLWWL